MDQNGLGNAMVKEKNEFTLLPLDTNAVQIQFTGDDVTREVKLGDVIELDYVDFVIESSSGDKNQIDSEKSKGVIIKFLPIESVASKYWSRFGTELWTKILP